MFSIEQFPSVPALPGVYTPDTLPLGGLEHSKGLGCCPCVCEREKEREREGGERGFVNSIHEQMYMYNVTWQDSTALAVGEVVMCVSSERCELG